MHAACRRWVLTRSCAGAWEYGSAPPAFATGLSQNALARLIADDSVSAGYISRWERGENMPSWTNLQALAGALGVTVAWLLEEDGDDAPAARAA